MTADYQNADGSLRLHIAHSANKRERSTIGLTRNKVGQDPFESSRSRSYQTKYYLVVDAPLNGAGFTDAELEADIKALLAHLQGAGVLAKFLGKES